MQMGGNAGDGAATEFKASAEALKKLALAKSSVVEIQENGVERIYGIAHVNEMQFTVAVDLSQVPEEDDYLMNPEHWTVESSVGESFSVTNVEKTSAAHSNDRQFLQSATHLVTVTSEAYPRRAQTLNLKLRVQPPGWIEEVSTDDDTAEDGRADKTFGFRYLLEGAVEAYEYYPEQAFINLPITLNR